MTIFNCIAVTLPNRPCGGETIWAVAVINTNVGSLDFCGHLHLVEEENIFVNLVVLFETALSQTFDPMGEVVIDPGRLEDTSIDIASAIIGQVSIAPLDQAILAGVSVIAFWVVAGFVFAPVGTFEKRFGHGVDQSSLSASVIARHVREKNP